MEQFAGHCHIVVIAADIQETTQTELFARSYPDC